MIESVILDWSGTAVDYGCFAPVHAFVEAFAAFDIAVTMEETRKPMGMLKREHIRTMLGMERIAALWEETHGHRPDAHDTERVYEQFEPKLFSLLEDYCAPKPYVLETVEELRAMGLKLGSTTGYTNAMMEIVAPGAAAQGYTPDLWVTPDSAGGKGRPYPYMIFENLKQLGISRVKNTIKVGDTVSDIREGVNAGVWSVGVVEGSSVLGLTQEEFESLSASARETVCRRTETVFREAGADFVLRDLRGLPALIRAIGR